MVTVLKRKCETIDHATVEMLCALLQPMHANYELRTEQLNKQSLLSSRAFVEHLLQLVVDHVEKGTGNIGYWQYTNNGFDKILRFRMKSYIQVNV